MQTISAPGTRSPEDLAVQLGTDLRRGLTQAEARARMARVGPNALRVAPRPPWWRRFAAQFADPLVGLLLVAVAITLVIWGAEGFEGWPFDALVIAAIVLLNGVLSHVQEARAENAVAALERLTVATSAVVRDGEMLRVPSTELVPGDLLSLAEGDAVGADARLVRCAALRVQEAALTGESAPVLKDTLTAEAGRALAERTNMVFKGTSVAEGTGLAVVTATGMRTEVGAIAEMLEATREAPTPLQREIGRVGRMLGIAVVAIAVIVVATVLGVSDARTLKDIETVLLLGVSLAVAAVPEGLPAILSVTLALGVQRMSRRNAIVKQLSSVETLGCATVICSDKTGTLTRSEMTIVRAACASVTADVSGVGYAPDGRFLCGGDPVPPGPALDDLEALVTGGCLAGNAQLRRSADGGWEIVGDPTEAAFLVAERKLGGHEAREARFERLREIPFTSERKRMSVVVRDRAQAGRAILVCKGAPDLLLDLCARERAGEGDATLDAARRARIVATVDAMSGDALRTLGVAWRVLEADEDPDAGEALERDLVYLGTVGIIDPPREEAHAAILEARRAGIRVLMITGDHPRTAARIASDLGLDGAGTVTGAQLDAMDDAAFREAVRTRAVFARVSPAHKLRIVGALKADGQVVAMTGDGVNDAPALKAADIGVAMGRTGTEVSREAAKMILADDDFATIVAAIREGRAIFDNITKFLRYLLSSNMGEVMTIFAGVVFAGVLGLAVEGGAPALPLLAVQILWINLLTDSWPAMAMAVDAQTDDLMARRPRHATERVIDAGMWSGVLQAGAVMALSTLLTIDALLPGGMIPGTGDLDAARTAGFTVLVFAQLFNVFAARSATRSAFHGLFANRWLWAAVAASLTLQVAVVHVPVLNAAFGTVPLDAGQWLACIAAGSVVLWYTELAKLLRQALR